LPYKHCGCFGDAPLVGCGFYADEHGAGSATGHGEDFARLMLLHCAVSSIGADHSAPGAASYAIDLLWRRLQGVGGLILLDRQGQIGIAHSSPNMAFAWMHEGMNEPVSGVKV